MMNRIGFALNNKRSDDWLSGRWKNSVKMPKLGPLYAKYGRIVATIQLFEATNLHAPSSNYLCQKCSGEETRRNFWSSWESAAQFESVTTITGNGIQNLQLALSQRLLVVNAY